MMHMILDCSLSITDQRLKPAPQPTPLTYSYAGIPKNILPGFP